MLARLLPSRVYYGWWVLGSVVFALVVSEGISFGAFGLYVEPLEREFGWSRAAVSAGFSVAVGTVGLFAPIVGRVIDTVGVRRLLFLSVPLCGGTFLLLATLSELWQWYLYLALNNATLAAIAYIPAQSLAVRWFERRRSIAVSAIGASVWIGQLVMVPIIQAIITGASWKTAFLVSSGLLVAGYVAALILVRDDPGNAHGDRERRRTTVVRRALPARAGRHTTSVATAAAGAGFAGEQQPDAEPGGGQVAAGAASSSAEGGAEAGGGGQAGEIGVTAREAVRTPLFWVTVLGMMLYFYVVFGWLSQAKPYFSSVGWSDGTGALFVSGTAGLAAVWLLSAGNVLGRPRRPELTAAGCCLCMAAGMLALRFTGGDALGIGLYIPLYVLGYAAAPLVEALIFSRGFGTRHFATILGVAFMFETMGILGSPVIAGEIYDEAGSYDWALVMYAVSAGGAAVVFLFALRLRQPLAALTRE